MSTSADRLRALAERDPGNLPLACDLFDAQLAAGDVAGAEATLRGAPADLRATPAMRFRLARCALVRQAWDEAARLLEELAAVDASDAIRHDLAFARMAMGRAQSALDALDLGGSTPDAPASALLRARILHHLGRAADALHALEPALRGAGSPDARGLHALIRLDLGDSTAAETVASEVLTAAPDQFDALLVMGTLALWHRDATTARELLQRTASRQPMTGRALLGMGQCLMLQGDVPSARAMLEQAAQAMPEHIGTWHALAWCQLLSGDTAGARRSFDRAFAIDRAFGDTHGGFAIVHALRGEREEAEAAIRRAMRLDPASRNGRYARSLLLMDEGRIDEARSLVEAMLSEAGPPMPAVPADFVLRLREVVRPRS